MAVEPCVRVCLHFSDRNEETCWFLVDFKKMPTIECIHRVIGRKFYKSETTSFKLTLKGSLLPAWESSFILRDDDQIIVEHEATSRHKKKPMANSQKSILATYSKHNSLGCTQTKNTGTSVGNEESILDPEALQNSVSTPNAETDEQRSNKKKKKKKLDVASELNIDKEEIPAPNKKQKISKSPKSEHSRKKKIVTKESKPELIEVVKVVSPWSENLKDENVNLCDKSDSRDLKKIKSEIIKVLDEVSVNSDDAIPKETSDAFPKMKDVSKVVKENSSEGSTSFIQLTDNIEKCLRKDFEPSANQSSVSDLEKSYKVQEESSSHSVQEKFEAYKIAKEDLNDICQSLKEGDTLTIDQDKVKVIDVENSSNSSWLDCVEVDSSFHDETKKLDTSAAKEKGKGSGNVSKRRRRRRGQRSFACSPFIHVMDQSLGSEADNKSPVFTPASGQTKKWSSPSNSSQKHFHFESDSEEDVEEENISQAKTTGDGDSKTVNNFESPKPTLSSDKIVTNGAEDSNSSFVLQGEEKDRILSSSEKQTPKKSVHFALENNSCQSFDSSQVPVIYKRGQISSQRRAYPTLIRQPKLNSVEDDRDTTSVNCSTTKPLKEYNLLPAIVGYPRSGDKIAFKRLEIGDDYTPRLSDFIEAKVMSFQEDTKMLTMKVNSQNNRRREGKFELFYEVDNDIMILDQQDDVAETVELSTLQEMKLLK